MVRVRFAPSPTGSLHIGGLRTALYNQLFALRHGGTFVLRIEDTDRTRLVEGGVENIIRTLAWAGVAPDEGPYLDESGSVRERGDKGPYVQSDRVAIYREHADTLLSAGRAYRCFCSSESLEEMKKAMAEEGGSPMYDGRCGRLSQAEIDAKLAEGGPHVIRLRVPKGGSTSFDDAIRGTVRFENAHVDEQVLMKSDGFPTYHLANVVDDHLMGITHVIRGEEWLPSTPKHVLLYQAFGWEPPAFAHLPLLLNPDRSKLSKRQGDVAVEDYRTQGYLPEALVNFIALLGWNPSGDREIYSKEELAASFDLGKVNKGGAVFNREKLDWLNREYLKAMPAEEAAERALPFYVAREVVKERVGDDLVACGTPRTFPFSRLVKAVSLEKSRATTLAELPEATAYLFADRVALDTTMLPGKKGTPEIARDRLAGMREFLAALPDGDFADAAALEAKAVAHVKEKGWTNAETLWPLRVALTGRERSPSPFEVAWALGKEETLARIDRAITTLA